jgi:AmmeMemoRadiSam system protein A
MTKLLAEQGQALVRLARLTLEAKLDPADDHIDGAVSKQLQLADAVFQEKHGVFVTLTSLGQLRGCIGNLSSTSSLLEGVKRNALSAALADYRFKPLQCTELDKIEIEVSVLSEPRRLEFADADDLIAKLRPGIDGVILRQGAASATFLPQVWEQLPDPDGFLGHLCHKAGLASNAWRNGRVEIETYQVQYFTEKQ